jgi:NADH-quinone oxidoreductase subunit J
VYVLLALVAVVGAVRMVTHTRPVYAALYFILVILASAATFLLLQAEFMAFALVIVYAGAILITYLFVLMLAQQSGESGGHGSQPAWYDRTPREPVFAVALGFLVLATLGDALFGTSSGLPWSTPPSVQAVANARQWEDLRGMPRLLQTEVEAAAPASLGIAGLNLDADGRAKLARRGKSALVEALREDGSVVAVQLDEGAKPSNSQRLGWALVASYPVSLELAGVVLLMAMFGAVVLARKQIELAEDERRGAAGLPRVFDDHGGTPRGGAS